MADTITQVPTIFTCHIGPFQTLVSKSDITAYLIRQVLMNPGGTSPEMEHEMVSFRKLNAEFGADGEMLASQFASAIKSILAKYFPDGTLACEVTYTQTDATTYKLAINVTDNVGNPVLYQNNVLVKVGSGQFNVQFDLANV